jgi:glycosyltransferase involved in cell wall biosynthesis
LEPLREFLRDSTVEVIYNGVQDCASTVRRPGKGRIGIIGRISPEKGQKIFVEAARRVHAVLPGTSFVICGGTQFSHGEAYLREVKDLAAGLPVEFTGWREDVREVLGTLDFLVVASLPEAEATTRVIPEAYSAGVPVLASDLPGIREILEDGENGFVFSPGDATALSERICDVLRTPAKLDRVTATARRTFEDRFSLEVFQRRIISSLDKAGTRALA